MPVSKKTFRLLQILPFIVLSAIVACTWFVFLTTNYTASWRHYILLTLMVINGILYVKKFTMAIVMTGVILILCSFYLLPPFKEIESAFIGIGPVQIPWIEWWSFLIFLVYCMINFHFLINLHLDRKGKKKQNRLI
jgi:hypothetical protein